MSIGKICAKYRKECGYRQIDVSLDTGYAVTNVSSFENGRNDNGYLFLWYILHGMTAEYLLENGVTENA